MARDLARMIVDYAEEEQHKFDNDLKDRYKKRLKMTRSFWYNHIKESIKKVMDKVEITTSWRVTDEQGQVLKVKGRWYEPVNLTEQEIQDLRQNPYILYLPEDDGEFWLEIQANLGKYLIREVFIPLDLKWDIDYEQPGECQFVVSWAHWPTE